MRTTLSRQGDKRCYAFSITVLFSMALGAGSVLCIAGDDGETLEERVDQLERTMESLVGTPGAGLHLRIAGLEIVRSDGSIAGVLDKDGLRIGKSSQVLSTGIIRVGHIEFWGGGRRGAFLSADGLEFESPAIVQMPVGSVFFIGHPDSATDGDLSSTAISEGELVLRDASGRPIVSLGGSAEGAEQGGGGK